MNARSNVSSFRGRLAAARLRHSFGIGSHLHPSLVISPGAVSAPARKHGQANSAATNVLAFARGVFLAGWVRFKTVVEQRREAERGRRLRVLETVALGDKRFLAIVQVRDQEFLVGSSASGVSLLTCLGSPAVSDAACNQVSTKQVSTPSTEGRP